MTELSGCRNDSGRRRNWRKYISNSGWFPGIGRLEREGELVEIARIELLRVLAETYSYFLLFFFHCKNLKSHFLLALFYKLTFPQKVKSRESWQRLRGRVFQNYQNYLRSKIFQLGRFPRKVRGRESWERLLGEEWKGAGLNYWDRDKGRTPPDLERQKLDFLIARPLHFLWIFHWWDWSQTK